jgi:hypothetical protein
MSSGALPELADDLLVCRGGSRRMERDIRAKIAAEQAQAAP